MSSIKMLSYNNFHVSFQKNGYLNATCIATQYNKRVGDYLRNERTQEYISALTVRLFNPETRNRVTAENQLVIIKKGGNDKSTQGTWLHPKLAIDFARWLDPKFAVWCDEQIEQIMSGKPSSQSNEELYRLFSCSIDYLIDHARNLHYLNAMSDSEATRFQFQETCKQIHKLIDFCNDNRLTSNTGRKVFQDGQLNYFSGNATVYGLNTLRLLNLNY